MSIRFEKPFRAGVAKVRARLNEQELLLFDLLCAAGQLGYRLPNDKINLAAGSGARDPRKRLRAEFPELRRSYRGALRSSIWTRASQQLIKLLLKELSIRPITEENRALRILLAYATIALAPDNVVPRDLLSRAAWDTAVRLFASLFPAKVKALGVLECVNSRLATLKREVAAGLKIGRLASGRRPGREGRKLAVDPELITLVGKALGKDLVPGYMARYLFYTKPGDHIWPHPDDPKFAVTVLICISHRIPADSSARSGFLAYGPAVSVKRYQLSPGSVLALEPGRIHAREPVRRGERVALLSIGLKSATPFD